jgi:hypothetical protein
MGDRLLFIEEDFYSGFEEIKSHLLIMPNPSHSTKLSAAWEYLNGKFVGSRHIRSIDRIAPDTLVTYALGSCVGICLYDGMKHIGGLAHILLPEHLGRWAGKNVYKFGNTAVKELRRAMMHAAARRPI